MRSRPVSPNAPRGMQRFNDLRLDPLPRVLSILDPTRWNVGPKFGESPYSRTRTRRKKLGFTWHESSPPDLQPYFLSVPPLGRRLGSDSEDGSRPLATHAAGQGCDQRLSTTQGESGILMNVHSVCPRKLDCSSQSASLVQM